MNRVQKHAKEALRAINDNLAPLGARAEIVSVGGNGHYRVELWLGERKLDRPLWLSCSPSCHNQPQMAARQARRAIAEARA